MLNLDDLTYQETIDFDFNTAVAGVPTTLAGTPVVSIYKDNSSTPITAGVTLTVDYGSVTGCHHVNVVTTNASYTRKSNYIVRVSTGTVGGQTIAGAVIAAFSIENRSPRRTIPMQLPDQKYATVTTLRFPLNKAGGGGLAASADYTPARSDLNLSIDGAAEANPAATIAYVNGSWTIALATGEATGKEFVFRLVSPDPKVVDDAWFFFRSYGNALAYYPNDVSANGPVVDNTGHAIISDQVG